MHTKIHRFPSNSYPPRLPSGGPNGANVQRLEPNAQRRQANAQGLHLLEAVVFFGGVQEIGGAMRSSIQVLRCFNFLLL